MEFVLGGASSMCAVLFTNPFDVLKTRQQLEGELIARTNLTRRSYNGLRQSFLTVVRTDGWRGLQKGLPAALIYQFTMNSVRLGTYQTAENLGWTRSTSNPSLTPLLTFFWGAFGGLASATASCPAYVVKTQLQAVSSGAYTARFQHHHRGTVSAFVNIYRQSGVRGLFRGNTASIARLTVGSSAQMCSFSACKEFLLRYDLFQQSIVLTALASSTVAGFFTSVFMCPCDVVTTRMTNQAVNASGRGLLYGNIFDCFLKIFRAEGLHGYYKGFVPMYLRVAPHTVLNLTFWEFFKGLYDRYSQQQHGH
ncbi:solute carrier family 25 member 35-like [Anopheles bellator]|uniref:solute carrier family 25 member 35-like n=1 Tax=Anopheles bellator TaxID=139047 RepID=UPI002649B5C8|nr:solute carrier family 25 member 35-like [Anopheles bellator]XP_058053640.1 solute carrier family 25 member 35-like [Anopheles bellator]